MLLVGDIGGTKTHLAIFSPDAGLRTPLFDAAFPSAQYASLEAVVEEFLGQTKVSVEKACFGVAGPVIAGKAKITNLPWVMEEDQLEQKLNIAWVRLLNDLEAMAHAIPLLEPDDLHTLNPGKIEPHGPIGVIAPGTGLGEAFLTWNGTRYQPHSSEGGHTDFAPTNDVEVELLRYLLKRMTHVSYERVCSGVGMPNIYDFLRDTSGIEELPDIAERLATAEDPNPTIVHGALREENRSELCSQTLSLFASILGAEAGNLALKVLATGGVYISGGIPPRILSYLQQEQFLHSFTNKGRFSRLVADVPVHVIIRRGLALLGAASYAMM